MQNWTELPFFQNEYPILETFLKSESRESIFSCRRRRVKCIEIYTVGGTDATGLIRRWLKAITIEGWRN
jgi:hypothetical protein